MISRISIAIYQIAAGLNFDAFLDKWNELAEGIGGLLLGLALTVTGIFAFVAGTSFWLARGDDEKIKKAKTAVKNFFIGWAVIIGLIVFIPVVISIGAAWGGITIIQ